MAIMGLLSILSALTGCSRHKLDGPGMERLGAELVNVTATSDLEGYWSEDSVGYVFEIFDNQVIVRSGMVQLETELVNRNGKFYLALADLTAAPDNQIYGYISDFRLKADTIFIKVYLKNPGRTDEHILKRVDYPYDFERKDSMLCEIAGTYESASGETVTIKKSETEQEKSGLTRHDCGYVMVINDSRGEKTSQAFFLGKKKYRNELTLVSTTDFNEGFIVRKNAEGEHELVSLIIEMGEEEYKTWEEIYKKR